jgi:hypothetical protein
MAQESGVRKAFPSFSVGLTGGLSYLSAHHRDPVSVR